jgi:hypothetical protein
MQQDGASDVMLSWKRNGQPDEAAAPLRHQRPLRDVGGQEALHRFADTRSGSTVVPSPVDRVYPSLRDATAQSHLSPAASPTGRAAGRGLIASVLAHTGDGSAQC